MVANGVERVQKEYGKLTAEQFQRLLGKLPEFQKALKDLPQVLREGDADKMKAVIEEGVYWAALYELPLAQHCAVAFYVLGLSDWLKEIAMSTDPQELLLNDLDGDVLPDDRQLEEKGFTPARAIAVLVSFQRTVLSTMLFKRSMSALVEAAREGDDDALFNAVRVDRSAVGCPSIAARIARAEAFGEKHFFIRLRNALKGPTGKHWHAYCGLRYSLVVLREFGFSDLSDGELHHLLVKVLKVYPDGYTARKNLRKQYYESKKIKSL